MTRSALYGSATCTVSAAATKASTLGCANTLASTSMDLTSLAILNGALIAFASALGSSRSTALL
eukprot:CAMPEP_0184538768 /NCGR_PEP_ID=MMETSP0198_2-20121128/17768_1 /TAXON_ID=1112570 /ORGANISM="Thraustochytrium sp., Strain LLF1b" /LENGTH=63 /DNA_ID=CAMNT_0026932237 /DNA_START=820 /DNA_END=1011 /DNA_ORIENTATION=+